MVSASCTTLPVREMPGLLRRPAGPAPDLGVETPWDQKKMGKTGVNPP